MTRFTGAGLNPIPAPPTTTANASWFRIDSDSRCFEGHFDSAPILPGVAHVALALSACSRRWGLERVLTQVRDVRFSRPLGPGDEVQVVLMEGKDPFSVRFEIRHQDQSATVGILVFKPD